VEIRHACQRRLPPRQATTNPNWPPVKPHLPMLWVVKQDCP